MGRDLVTGGCGFIGNALVKALLRAGRRVTVLDNLSTGQRREPTADYIVGDVRDSDAMRKAVKMAERVFHLAGFVWVRMSFTQPEHCQRINADGSRVVAEVAAGRPMLLASTCAVYGTSATPMAESAVPMPISPYAESKLAAEKRWPGIVCRFFNVYGPGQLASSSYAGVISKFAQQAQSGLPMTVYGTGLQTRDYIYVDDVVDGMLKLVGQAPGVYNLGTGVGTDVLTVAKSVAEALEKPLSVEHQPAQTGDAEHARADMTKTREATGGWMPKVSFGEGLVWTIRGRS